MDPASHPELAEDATWQPAFSALLSKEGNFARAAKVRQRAALESVLRLSNISPLFMEAPVFEAEMTDVDGAKYLCVFFCQREEMYPGNGSLSYYWFRPDGTVVGAGLMNTGHRCEWSDCAIENPPASQPAKATVFVLTVKFNTTIPQEVRFVLGRHGLEYIPDMKDPLPYGLHLGESLIEQ